MFEKSFSGTVIFGYDKLGTMRNKFCFLVKM